MSLNDFDATYHGLLTKILELGELRSDRTGTGTKSIFGTQAAFDLSHGKFPLLTTKKVNTKAVVNEFLWMITHGSTDVAWLNQRGHSFWDAWKKEDGTIGPGYGKQFRNIKTADAVVPKVFDVYDTPVENATVFGVGRLGDYDRSAPMVEGLKSIWRDMLRRCYYKASSSYASYGAKGVHVEPRWLDFANFQQDVTKIPNYLNKLEWPEEYTLDKDILFASNRYSKDTCMWATHEEQSWNTSTNRAFYAVSPEGVRKLFPSIGEMVRNEGVNTSAVHRCLDKDIKLHTHHGWSKFEYVENEVMRFRKVDQIKDVIASIKHNPDSRRHIISLWAPADVPFMGLPPCHGNLIQFYVRGGTLDLQMYQRSGDVFLGVPWNIAFYSLFLVVIAQLTGLTPGVFTHSYGDLHIYTNHFDQVMEQLSRDSYPAPTLSINPEVTSIEDFTFEDFTFTDYQSHSTIKAEVSV